LVQIKDIQGGRGYNEPSFAGLVVATAKGFQQGAVVEGINLLLVVFSVCAFTD